MEMLHDMAHSGKTIAATVRHCAPLQLALTHLMHRQIHQPSSEIYALFDNLLLLSQGEIVYYGPAAKAMEYFTSCVQ